MEVKPAALTRSLCNTVSKNVSFCFLQAQLYLLHQGRATSIYSIYPIYSRTNFHSSCLLQNWNSLPASFIRQLFSIVLSSPLEIDREITQKAPKSFLPVEQVPCIQTKLGKVQC